MSQGPSRLLTSSEVDRLYRMRKGTASAAWKNGRIPGKRRGNRILLSAKRAEELFGVDGVTL